MDTLNAFTGVVRRCVDDYDMILPGDRIAVGISGGKDSLVLLRALHYLKGYYPAPFELEPTPTPAPVPAETEAPVPAAAPAERLGGSSHGAVSLGAASAGLPGGGDPPAGHRPAEKVTGSSSLRPEGRYPSRPFF